MRDKQVLSTQVCFFGFALFAWTCSARAAEDNSPVVLLTELTAAAVTDLGLVEVLSTDDVRKVLAFEAEKQTIGCDEAASCLAEIADALGTRYLVYGNLSRLDDQLFLSMNLFDSTSARIVDRQVVRGAHLTELADRLVPAVSRLFRSALATQTSASSTMGNQDKTERLRVFVMEFKSMLGTEPLPQGPPRAESEMEGGDSFRTTLGVTGIVLGIGALVAGGGGLWSGSMAAAAQDDFAAATLQSKAVAALQERDSYAGWANMGFVTAGALAVLSALSFVIPEMLGEAQ